MLPIACAEPDIICTDQWLQSHAGFVRVLVMHLRAWRLLDAREDARVNSMEYEVNLMSPRPVCSLLAWRLNGIRGCNL